MKGRFLTETQIAAFAVYLESEEKSKNTCEKYIRDVRAFASYMNGTNVAKEAVIAYKNKLLSENYAARSINSMLASLNSLFSFLSWADCRVKSIKLQRQIYCPEEKEMTKAEYLRLLNTAKWKGNERLSLLIQTICGTGIRVSELHIAKLADILGHGNINTTRIYIITTGNEHRRRMESMHLII